MRGFLKHHRSKIIIIGYVLVTAGLGLAGLVWQYPGLPVVDYGIRTFQMFSFGGVGTPDGSARSLNTGLLIARALAAAFTITAGAVVLRHLAGEQWTAARLRFTGNHVVVCGLGTKGGRLVTSLRAQGRKVAVIENNAEADTIADARESGALVLSGDATSKSLLKRAGLARAAALVALSGSDRTNVGILMEAAALPRKRPAALRCAVHLSSPRTRELLQQSDFFPRDASCEVRFFNVEEVSARKLMLTLLPQDVQASPRAPIAPHLIIVGFGALGESLAVQYARLAHYPNGAKPRLTVVTAAAAQEEPRFLARRPYFREACELQFVACDATAEALGALPALAAPGPGESRHFVVAGEDDVSNFLAGLELLDACPELTAPVHLRMRDVTGLKNLADQAAARGKRAALVPFGEMQAVCSPEIVLDEQLDQLARAVHEQYAREVAARGGAAPPTWEELDEDLREACRRQADHHEVKLHAIGARLVPAGTNDPRGFRFSDAELEELAQSEHRRWCAERRLAGWSHASVRDNLRRLHPLLVPWNDLDPIERGKNYETIRLLPQMMSLIGLEIERV